MDFEVIKAEYLENPTLEHTKFLASKYQIPLRSLIGQLSKAGVYQKAQYKSKVGTDPITKLEIVASIAELVGVDNLEGLEKAHKQVLFKLEKALKELV
jgi:hypothetical protein